MEFNQAGLSWEAILKKEVGFRKDYHNFNIKKSGENADDDVERLLNDASIIRNRLKFIAPFKRLKPFWNYKRSTDHF